jgi:MFS family permease
MTATSPAREPRLTRARLAVVGAFCVNGLLYALWIVNIPAIERNIGVSHGTLGGLLLLLGLGAFLGMQVTGSLVDRFGSRKTVIVSGLAMSLAIITPALASSAWALALALVAVGFTSGGLDVSMNAHGVIVERAYGRPILSSFHAFFSIGGALGAFLGALLKEAELSVLGILIVAAAIGIALMAASARFFLTQTDPLVVAHGQDPQAALARTDLGSDGGQGSALDVSGSETGAEKRQAAGREGPGRHRPSSWLMLGVLAFLFMLAEGVANDWSALQITEHLGVGESRAALGYGFFAVAMTVGRLSADRMVQRLGAILVVRCGAALAAAGLVLIVVSGHLAWTLAGWALLGLGLSGIVPQIFSAAGNLPSGRQGANLARVVGCGYLGFLAGPAVIGWVAQVSSVTQALIVPLALVVIGALLAPFIASSRRG